MYACMHARQVIPPGLNRGGAKGPEGHALHRTVYLPPSPPAPSPSPLVGAVVLSRLPPRFPAQSWSWRNGPRDDTTDALPWEHATPSPDRLHERNPHIMPVWPHLERGPEAILCPARHSRHCHVAHKTDAAQRLTPEAHRKHRGVAPGKIHDMARNFAFIQRTIACGKLQAYHRRASACVHATGTLPLHVHAGVACTCMHGT